MDEQEQDRKQCACPSPYNVFNFVLYLGQAFVTVAIGLFGLAGFPTTLQVSDIYPTLISPASWVYISITTLVLIVQLIWAVAQLWRPEHQERAQEGVKHYYVGVSLSQLVWVMLFSYELVFVSFFASLSLLVFLGFIIYDQNRLPAFQSMTEYAIHKFPFVANAGWMLYVILWNLCVVLAHGKVSLNAQYLVALISIVTMGLVSFYTFVCRRAEYEFPSLICYVTFGICINLINPQEKLLLWFSKSQIDSVQFASLVISALILVASSMRLWFAFFGALKRQQEPGEEMPI